MAQASGPRLTKRELEREQERQRAAAAAAAASGQALPGSGNTLPPSLAPPPVSAPLPLATSSGVMMSPAGAAIPSPVAMPGAPQAKQAPPGTSGFVTQPPQSVYPYDQVSNDELQFFTDIGGLHDMGMGPDVTTHPDPRRPLGLGLVGPSDGAGMGDLLQKRRADEAFSQVPPHASMPGVGVDGEVDSYAQMHTESKPKKKKTVGSAVPVGLPTTPVVAPSSAASTASTDKASKGLRHFSMRVCKKVEEKGRTNYNEVADELVREVLQPKYDPVTGVPEQFDEKNIRRRVYDALNVLMAMDIISKEKKEIRWKGLPSNAQHDIEVLQRDRRRLEQSLAKKREHLQELIMQRIAFKRLIKRNAEREMMQPRAATEAEEPKIPLPFIIINTNSQTIIQCEMTEDRSDVFFNFSAPFEINDDNEILKRLELRKARQDELLECVPHQLLRYVPAEVYTDSGIHTLASATSTLVDAATGTNNGQGFVADSMMLPPPPPVVGVMGSQHM